MTDSDIGTTRIECESQACRDIHSSIPINEGTFICSEIIKAIVNNPDNDFKIRELLS